MKNKSIDFLLKNAGPVIQYRLRKEIIGKISEEDKRFLDEIYELPVFRQGGHPPGIADYFKRD